MSLKRIIRTLTVVCSLMSGSYAFGQTSADRELPLVWVLSTGGTIAGQGASSTQFHPGTSQAFSVSNW